MPSAARAARDRAGRPGTRCRARARRRRGSVAGSSPRATTRRACSAWLTRWRWLSFVIAWRSASSNAPPVCSPPWRWTIGTRSTVAAIAAAAVSKRSPTSSRASAGRLAGSSDGGECGRGLTSAGGSRRSSSQASSASGSKPSSRMSSMVRPCRADRCMPPTSRSWRSGWSRMAAQVERRMPQSWRPVVRTAIVRGGPRRGHRGAPGRRRRRAGRRHGPGRPPDELLAAGPATCRSPGAARRGRRRPLTTPAASVAPSGGSGERRPRSPLRRTGAFSPVPSATSTVRIPRPSRRKSSGSSDARGPDPERPGRASGASRSGRTERHGRERQLDAEGVVGPAGRNAEGARRVSIARRFAVAGSAG